MRYFGFSKWTLSRGFADSKYGHLEGDRHVCDPRPRLDDSDVLLECRRGVWSVGQQISSFVAAGAVGDKGKSHSDGCVSSGMSS